MATNPAVARLAEELNDVLCPKGGLREARWAGKLVVFMEETVNCEGREYLLKIIQNTPCENEIALARLYQLNIVDILARWITEHKGLREDGDLNILHLILSAFNKLILFQDSSQRQQISKLLNSLKYHEETSIRDKALSVLSKCNKNRIIQANKRRKVVSIPVKKWCLYRPKVTEDDDEVYIPLEESNIGNTEEPPAQRRMRIKWNENPEVKTFWRDDAPSAACATTRPIPDPVPPPLQGTLASLISKEIGIERDLNNKVRPTQESAQKERIRRELQDMVPNAEYRCPIRSYYIGLRVRKTRVSKNVVTGEIYELIAIEKCSKELLSTDEVPSNPTEPTNLNAKSGIEPDTPLIPSR